MCHHGVSCKQDNPCSSLDKVVQRKGKKLSYSNKKELFSILKIIFSRGADYIKNVK